jgi:hypothetical protein
MELIIFSLATAFVGVLAIVCGGDSRPSEHDHIRNW